MTYLPSNFREDKRHNLIFMSPRLGSPTTSAIPNYGVIHLIPPMFPCASSKSIPRSLYGKMPGEGDEGDDEDDATPVHRRSGATRGDA